MMILGAFLSFEGFVLAIALAVSAIVTFSSLFTLVSLIDLESDFVNPTDMCKRTNLLVIPEYAAHAFLVFLFLITGFWTEFLINLPMLAYNVYRLQKNEHKLDPTRIFAIIDKQKKINFFRLLYYVVCLCYYLYREESSLFLFVLLLEHKETTKNEKL